MKSLEFLEDTHGNNPDAAIIWLHGLGADGYDFLPIVQQLNLPRELSIQFIFPHAPVQPVTINQGAEVNAWYDIYEFGLEADEDYIGITKSMHLIESLIQSKCSHIDPSRILLVGFSQGGALVLHTLLHGQVPIGGIIALSTYLPLRDIAPEADKKRVTSNEIFMAHGAFDEVLPYEFGELSKNILLALGANISWQKYPIAHQVSDEQIADISNWIVKKLSD